MAQSRAREKMVTAVFRDRAKAQMAYSWLLKQGYNPHDVHVLMSEGTRTYFAEHDEPIEASLHVAEGASVGGAVGTAIGATLGAVAAMGTSIAIPGLGLLIAGPLAAALAGGGAGAVAGGLIGALVGLGIPESNVKAYEEALREGGVVIGVQPKTKDDGKRIQQYFETVKADNVCYC